MPRQRRKPQSSPEEAEQSAVAAAGGNVTDAVARKHFGKILALETKMASVRGELAAAWKEAESDGIERKPFKGVMKLMAADPATADAYLRKVMQYTQQLGLFDRINDWKAAEEQEANKASADVAERETKHARKPKAEAPAGEPTSGGVDEAIYAQGFQAGLDGAARTSCPIFTQEDQQDTWYRGHAAGALKRVDDANSARVMEGADA